MKQPHSHKNTHTPHTTSQALQLPGGNRKVLISTTLQVISITLLVVGGALPSLLRALNMGETDSLDPGEMDGVAEAVTCSVYDVEGDEYGDTLGGDSLPPLSRAGSVVEDARPLLLSNNSSLSSTGGGSFRAAQRMAVQFSPIPDRPPTLPNMRGFVDESLLEDELQGRVHRVWAGIDEALKPFFGGRSRMPTPHGSYRSNAGSYASTITVRAGHGGGYGSMAFSPPASSNQVSVPSSGGKPNGGGNGGRTGAGGGGGGGAGAGGSWERTNSTGNRGVIDPRALQAAFDSKGFHVPKRTLNKLANQKPDGTSAERKMKSSHSASLPSKK